MSGMDMNLEMYMNEMVYILKFPRDSTPSPPMESRFGLTEWRFVDRKEVGMTRRTGFEIGCSGDTLVIDRG